MSAARTSLRASSLVLAIALCASASRAQQAAAGSPSESVPPADQPPAPSAPAEALPTDPSIAEPDPAADMAPLPGMEVDWPTIGDSTTPVPGEPAPAVAAASSDAQAERKYRTEIIGLSGDEGVPADIELSIRSRFKLLSALDEGKGSGNTAQIDRRAQQDEQLLGQLLRAAGYYDASVSTRTENEAGGRLLVRLTVDAGAVYTLAAVELPGIEKAGGQADKLRTAFGLKAEEAADSDKIAAGQIAIREQLGRDGFVFAKVGDPEITVDHELHQASLKMAVDPGAAARIGKIIVDGPRLFSAKHLGRIARFHPGDHYDTVKMEDFRRALIQTSLVSSVTIKPVPTADPGVVDVAVHLERAPPRTISGSIGYGTGEGYRLEASWQHRNLIRPEGAVTFRGVLGTQEQSAGAILRRNNYKARDRVLTGQLLFSHLNQTAYEAKTITLAAGLERQTTIIWQKKWTWFYGGELSASNERDTVKSTGVLRNRKYLTGALPTGLSYDGSDDLLNPSRGYRLAGRISPELSLQGSAFSYVKAQIDASYYLPITGGTVLASRARFGSIFGASAQRIAPTRRFYAGGGGSVRGYGYQKIGPVDINGDPAGGRSLAEFSIEARVRFGDFGVVPFLDAGNLYDARLPTFKNLRYGTGLGVRYYTSFGPIRVDVGTPINRRSGDSKIAVYVSLGQAF